MALNAYLSLQARGQGVIRGSVTQKGREGSILVFGFWHEIVCPRDPASGQPTGKRAHKPFVIQKQVDRASPLLWSALCNNESLELWWLQLYAPSLTGAERNHFGVRLVEANIASITLKMANNRKPRLARLPEYEEVAFTYQKIEWTWTEGAIAGGDDWEAPR